MPVADRIVHRPAILIKGEEPAETFQRGPINGLCQIGRLAALGKGLYDHLISIQRPHPNVIISKTTAFLPDEVYDLPYFCGLFIN